MKVFRAFFLAFFGHFAGPSFVKGGSGHFNEQCHPGTYN